MLGWVVYSARLRLHRQSLLIPRGLIKGTDELQQVRRSSACYS